MVFIVGLVLVEDAAVVDDERVVDEADAHVDDLVVVVVIELSFEHGTFDVVVLF